MNRMRELGKIITVKPEPETTPSLADIIQRDKAVRTVSEYLFTAALRGHTKRVLDCVVNDKGQGFWVQAEYGAGKTHFLGTVVDLLVWQDEEVWDHLRDEELKNDYAAALSKKKWFPVAFSLRGMGQAGDGDSLMRVFEEEIRESIKALAPALDEQVKITSAELADLWYRNNATDAERAGVRFFFDKEHKCSPDDYRSKDGPKKFGQELVRSKLPEGRLRGQFKERFAYIYEQVTTLGGYDGIVFVIDEFRSWQDRHPAGTPAYAEDEEILETLAYVLPTQHLNIITIIASQGDMPQKLSGGGEGDRFVPLSGISDLPAPDGPLYARRPPSARNSVRRTIVQLQRPSPQPTLTWNRPEPLLSGHFSDTAPHLCPFFANLRCTRPRVSLPAPAAPRSSAASRRRAAGSDDLPPAGASSIWRASPAGLRFSPAAAGDSSATSA